MSFETACQITDVSMVLFDIGVPAWLIFYPPRPIRLRPLWLRAVLAIAVAEAGLLAVIHGVYYPAHFAVLRAHALAHPNATLFLDRVFLPEPLSALCFHVCIVAVFMTVRALAVLILARFRR